MMSLSVLFLSPIGKVLYPAWYMMGHAVTTAAISGAIS